MNFRDHSPEPETDSLAEEISNMIVMSLSRTSPEPTDDGAGA